MLTGHDTDINIGFTHFSSFSETSATSPLCWETSILTQKQNKTKKKRVRKRVFPQAKADTRRWMLRDSLTSRKFVCWWVWTCRFPPRHFVPPYQRGRCSDATATLSNRENRHLYSRRDQSKTQPMSSKAGSFSVNFHPDQLWTSIFQKPPVTEKKILKKKEYKKNSSIQM